MSNKIKVVLVEPHKPAREAEIFDSLSSLQQTVDGYIEITYPFDDNAVVIGNEEAKLEGLDGTARINGQIYCGNLIIAGDDEEGGLMSLTDEQVKTYLEMFAEPEEISPDEIEDDLNFGFQIFGW